MSKIDYPENINLPFYRKSFHFNPHLTNKIYAGISNEVIKPDIKPWERVFEQITPSFYRYNNHSMMLLSEQLYYISLDGNRATDSYRNPMLAFKEIWDNKDTLLIERDGY